MRRLQVHRAVCILSLCCMVAVSLPCGNGWCWWFQQSDEELLRRALESDNPRKVEKSLDVFIKKQNYAAIQQIKQHAKRMLQKERSSLSYEQKTEPAVIKKRVAPWKQIEQRADYFFKRTPVPHNGQNNVAP